MGKQTFHRAIKALTLLLLVSFIVSLTATSVSAWSTAEKGYALSEKDACKKSCKGESTKGYTDIDDGQCNCGAFGRCEGICRYPDYGYPYCIGTCKTVQPLSKKCIVMPSSKKCTCKGKSMEKQVLTGKKTFGFQEFWDGQCNCGDGKICNGACRFTGNDIYHMTAECRGKCVPK